ncbi:amidohydrolase family protein [Stieleria varia]|uniref:4-sulfomuconolactone hydrolase n=1 Tax=Stieleria varia TaxID=2528005 RepID=A0A5C6B305_9BACT|nr:amidohydrolase family protein [Stieleria varia]TWU06503.1 4-sulfomuconolactone hydrolase [Stieleria varia]
MSEINRREFIAAVTTAATGTLGASCAMDTNAMADDSLGLSPIDAHVHVWTPDTDTYPLAEGYDKQSMKPASFTPAELFAACKPYSVDRIVLIQMSFYQYDNRYMIDTMKKHPGVFGGVAIVDSSRPDVAIRMSQLAEHGVRGFRLYANEKNTSGWATNDGINAMWRAGADRNLAMCLLTDPESLPAIHQQCERFPDTKVVIDHFARIGMTGTVNQKQLDQLKALSKFKNLYVKTSAFYALGNKRPPHTELAPMIRQLRDAFGADRLMWASDCPFQLDNGNTYQSSIELIRDRIEFLNAAEKRSILQTTAEKLFFS